MNDLQAKSTNTLALCPFCGGEAECHQWWSATISGKYATVCTKCNCGTDFYATEAEAIAAWNMRVDYHGYEQAAIEAWESIKAWNSRAERTCRNVSTTNNFRCSECDAADLDFDKPSYCHGCGAKVIGG